MKTNALYESMKVKELKELLRKRKIKFSGKSKKIDLIKLLESSDKKKKSKKKVVKGTKESKSKRIEKRVNKKLEGKSKQKENEKGSERFVDMEEVIPDRYNETRIVLLVKDPNWIFAYWETSDNDKEKLKGIEVYKWVLRVYNDVGEDFDIVITETSMNWYINVPESGRSYYVELGVIDKSGNFTLVAKSNKITTPPGKFSDIVDEEWMIVEEEFKELYKILKDGNVGGSSEVLLKKFLNKLEKEITTLSSSKVGKKG